MKRLFAYNPTLAQAWGLVALTILAQLVSGLVVLPFISLTGGAQAWHQLLSYVLCFVLMAFIVIRLGGQRPTANGERPTENGQRRTANGERSTANGQRRTANGERPTENGVRSLPFTVHRSPFTVHRLSFTVYRLPFTVVLLLFMPALAVVIEPLSMWIPMPEAIKQVFEAAFKDDVPTFLSAVVAAPVAEEWLCRGVILKGLLTHYAPRKAIIWSAVLFGVLHMNPWQAIPAFCIALAIGWVYWRTRSLWPCIFMHAVNNSIAFLLLLLFPDVASDASTKDIAGAAYGFVYAGALLCCALTGYGIWRMLRKNYPLPER